MFIANLKNGPGTTAVWQWNNITQDIKTQFIHVMDGLGSWDEHFPDHCFKFTRLLYMELRVKWFDWLVITKYSMLTTSQKLHIPINQILATSPKYKYEKVVQNMKKEAQQITFQW